MAYSGKLKYIYLNGNLHRVLHVSRPNDLVTLWDFAEHSQKIYAWSDVKRRAKPAYTVTQAAKLIGRHRDNVLDLIQDGVVPKPQRIYSLKGEGTRPGKYMLSDEDILNIHEYLASIHIGRPRKDGKLTNKLAPKHEIVALLNQGRTLYIKDDNGEYIPVWRES